MAKKHKKHSRRVRGVGAVNPKSPLVKIASLAAGYFLADTINGALDKVPMMSTQTTTDPSGAVSTPGALGSVRPYLQTGAGAYLLMSKKGSLVKTAAGGLLAGSGLKLLLKKFGVISGYQAVPVIGGYQAVPVIGNRVPAQLQGTTPAQLQGYRVNGYQPNGSGMGVMGSRKVNGAVGALYTTGSGLNNETASGYMN